MRVITLCLGLFVSGAALAAPPVAQQGGRLAESHGHRLELVAAGDALQLLISDGENRPVPSEGWSGKAVVLASGGKVDVALAPAGDNRVSGRLPAGAELAAAVVTLRREGQAVSARFPALKAPPRPSAELAAKGGAIYRENCVECHGENLEGQPDWRVRLESGEMPAPPLDAAGHAWHHGDAELAQVIRGGGGIVAAPGQPTTMPPFGEVLTAGQIEAVIAFVKSRWPLATLAQQPQGAIPAATASGQQDHSSHH